MKTHLAPSYLIRNFSSLLASLPAVLQCCLHWLVIYPTPGNNATLRISFTDSRKWNFVRSLFETVFGKWYTCYEESWTERSLLNRVVCVVTWVTWVRGLRGYVGCVGYVGQHFTWVAWVKYIFAWVKFFCVGLCVGLSWQFLSWVTIFCVSLKKSWLGLSR